MHSIATIILSFTLFFFNRLHAQLPDEKNFSLYSLKDGLSNNQVSSITQDAYGYMWIASQKGLNRFDGNSFLQFYADSNRSSLPEDAIRNLKWLDKENLGVITSSGLHIINTRTLHSRNIIIPAGPLKYLYKVNKVSDMLSDKEGNVFLLTGSGFYHFNKKDELLFRYDHFKTEQVETATFQFGRHIVQPDKHILLLSSLPGLYVYDIAKKDIQAINQNSNETVFYRSIIAPGYNFNFMYGDEHCFSFQNGAGMELSVFDTRNKIKNIMEAPFATIDKFNWRSKLFRLNDTLYAISGKEKGFYLIKHNRESGRYIIEPKSYFENYFCNSIFMDKDNRMWVGTNRGFFREKRPAGSLEKITVTETMGLSASDLQIRMMTIARDKLFAATNTQGLLVFDRSSMNLQKRIDFFSYWKRANTGYNVVTVNEDTVMAGTYGALIWVNTRSLTHGMISLPGWNKETDWVSSLFKDSRNDIYTARNRYNQFYYRNAGNKKFALADHKQNPLFNILVPRNIAEDPEGNIWFVGSGISRFNRRLQQFDILMDSFPGIKNQHREIHCLAFDQKGKLYFGLRENGLMIYDPAEKKYDQLTRSNGLPDNNVRAVYIHRGKVWMGTESGLASYDPSTKRIESFGVSDGLPAEPFTAYSFYYDSIHHHLYGALANTIVRFDPDELTKSNSPPGFFIESITVTGKENFFHPADKIELSYKHNNLVVNLAAINFEDAYQQQFAYRFVKNGNEAWQQTGSQRSIIFSNLSPGNHRLQVKAFIKNNSWPEQVKEIIIVIKPPFWQTTWFILLAGLLILTAFYVLYRYRIRVVHQKANIDRQLAELEIKGLHAQMNPHFIFNSLNSIKEMILEDEKQNASRYLSKFAQLIRTNLEQSRQTFITVKQCIDHLHQYLEMEKIRFEQFNYTIDADEDLPDDIRMAPMLIQPLAENAIWHGLRNKPGEKYLNIRFYRSHQQLVCEIEDNGIGIRQSMNEKDGRQPTHRSLGIASIHERLKVLNEKYNMNSSLEIIDKSELAEKNDSGTRAVLRFNI